MNKKQLGKRLKKTRFTSCMRRKGAVKVIANGDSLDVSDFSGFLLERLGIPTVRFPKGDPYSERTWPQLTWRMLYRHIYRQERFWSELADKQPEVEQFACVMQFLGVAARLFPEEYGLLVSKKKELSLLQTTKDEFRNMLNELSKELIDQKELTVAVTEDSIDNVIQRINSQIQEIQVKREEVLQEIRQKVGRQQEAGSNQYGIDSDKWATIDKTIREKRNDRQDTQIRFDELKEYKASLQAEIERLQRLRAAGSLIADLKVTHCPVCDQLLSQRHSDPDSCYLCGRPYVPSSTLAGNERIDFELSHLTEELKENEDLLQNISNEAARITQSLEELESIHRRLEVSLATARRAAVAFLPPELTMFEMKIGGLQEQKRQLELFRRAHIRRKDLSTNISNLETQIQQLQSETDRLGTDVNLTGLEDG